MAKRITIGPDYPIIQESIKVNVKTEGDIIYDVDIEIGFAHRGIEALILKRNFWQVLEIVERICGLCSHTHALAYSLSVENLAKIKVPMRAQFIRTIIAELERLHSHLFWIDAVSKTLEFELLAEYILEIREGIMDILETISGNRVMFSINTIGGVRRDIKNPKQILKMLDRLKVPMDSLYKTFDCNTQILDKTKGIGILSHKKAKELGVVGPTAEASGISNDIRKEAPYAAYNQIKLKPTVLSEGDAYSRIIIRFWEIFESIEILQQLVKKMPNGSVAAPEISVLPSGCGIGRVEAPRGELIHFLISGGSKIPERLKVRPPTFANLPAVREMLVGDKKENMNLILASIDPCFACTER